MFSKPLFKPIPVSTKYTTFPITGNNSNSVCEKYENFSLENNFNPGSYAPFNHYLENIDLELKYFGFNHLSNQIIDNISRNSISKLFFCNFVVWMYFKVIRKTL